MELGRLEEISVDELSGSVDDGGDELSAVDVIVSNVVTATVTVCTDEVLTSVGSELDGRASDSDAVELPVSSVEVGTDEVSDSELDTDTELVVGVSVSMAEKELGVTSGGTEESGEL